MRYVGESRHAYAAAMFKQTDDKETIERLSLKTRMGRWKAITRIKMYTREGGRRDQLRRLLAVSLAEGLNERGYIERIKELEVHRQALWQDHLGGLDDAGREMHGGTLADAGGELQQLLRELPATEHDGGN